MSNSKQKALKKKYKADTKQGTSPAHIANMFNHLQKSLGGKERINSNKYQ